MFRLPIMPKRSINLFSKVNSRKQRFLRKLSIQTLTPSQHVSLEHLFYLYGADLPLTIVRPSIISCSWKYPTPGWMYSKAAVAGFIALLGSGFLRVVDGLSDTKLDIVPVEVVANDVIEKAILSTRQ
jgi:hypothetical protein